MSTTGLNGFPTLNSFLEYSRGASVAPASIFVHLCGLIQKNDRFIDPPFNVKEAAITCAIFSYLVHIIRDFQKDQFNNLNYFADDRIIKIRPLMEPRYQLSLEIIFDLYLMAFERINVDKGSFTSLELNPTPEETRKRVYENIIKFRP